MHGFSAQALEAVKAEAADALAAEQSRIEISLRQLVEQQQQEKEDEEVEAAEGSFRGNDRRAHWVRLYDEHEDIPYYFNAETNETQWNPPIEFAEDAVAVAAAAAATATAAINRASSGDGGDSNSVCLAQHNQQTSGNGDLSATTMLLGQLSPVQAVEPTVTVTGKASCYSVSSQEPATPTLQPPQESAPEPTPEPLPEPEPELLPEIAMVESLDRGVAAAEAARAENAAVIAAHAAADWIEDKLQRDREWVRVHDIVEITVGRGLR